MTRPTWRASSRARLPGLELFAARQSDQRGARRTGDGARIRRLRMSCGSGMAALHLAITAALVDRRRVILAASALYGATINMLMKVLAPRGIETFRGFQR